MYRDHGLLKDVLPESWLKPATKSADAFGIDIPVYSSK
jgi:hypothetical protein